MREIEFRFWDKVCKRMINPGDEKHLKIYLNGCMAIEGVWCTSDIELMQYIGIEDAAGKEFYIGDIARFNNGDTFQICKEEWLQVYVDWIGDPECEDQTRDLYRIGNATIIGNIYQNPELLKH